MSSIQTLFKEQLQAIKEQDNLENLTQYTIFQLMNAAMPKAKDSGKVNFTRKKLDEYFPSDYSAEKREEIILSLLSDWKKQRDKLLKKSKEHITDASQFVILSHLV